LFSPKLLAFSPPCLSLTPDTTTLLRYDVDNSYVINNNNNTKKNTMRTAITLLRDHLRSVTTIGDVITTLLITGLGGLFITGWTSFVFGLITGTIPVPQF